ncbi:MAG: 2OG-Fe(II) oxygenase [Kofleriaceae bacterium]|nr:2OG-Fe(II) oxygenase [Kofleriaceae bacterium]MCB9572815.1 2OG-Fe(II) oxygenase [Kofleriaceae bacterium]
MSDRPPSSEPLLGNPLRTAEASADAPDAYRDAIEAIHQDRLDSMIVRGALPEATRQALLARLAGDDALAWRRPNRTGPQVDIRVLGVAATPTFETPGGPPVDAYFTDAAAYEDLYAGMLDGGPGAPTLLEALLAGTAGGRPVGRLVQPDGRRFAACTIRSLPEDQRIIVHNDFYHYKLPVYREVVDQLDTSTCLSFLVLLQAPEAGGEVVMHALTAADPTPRLPGGLPDGDTIRARYRAEHLKMAAGDLLLFAAGRLYHHVSPVVGATPRITLGGFLTLDRDHARVTYWN